MSRKKRRRSKSRRYSPGTFLVLLLLLALALYATLTGLDPADLPVLATPWIGTLQPTATPVFAAGTDEPGDWLQIYFTDPGGPQAGTRRGGPDTALAQAIGVARVSVDIAAQQINLWSLRDALLEAHQRGVTVRIVIESDYHDEAEVLALELAGIPVLGDRREGLMHNKFVIIDRQDVWSGSMNFTLNGAYENDNNLIHLRSARLAENYLAEFEEMFVDDEFGPNSPVNTPHPGLTINGTRVETFFSPEDDTSGRLVELIGTAEESVHFLAYSFTSDEIADAMIDRAQQGVQVAGVFEEGQYLSNQGTEFDRFRREGVDVRLDGNPGNMHHKVIIIDQRILVTGSYNFSANAENRNDENTLILHSPQVAALYEAEFQRVFDQAQLK